MPINAVALIAGALSFSAALAWNKAISDSLSTVVKTKSSVIQAVIITLIIIIVVYLINVGLRVYTYYTDEPLKDSVIKAGSISDSKVKLWNK